MARRGAVRSRALRAITPAERAHVLEVLEERLVGSGADWRDVDAVAALGTAAADTLLGRCARHPDATVRLRAAPILAERGHPEALEGELLRILLDPNTDAPIEATMRLAEKHPSEPVKDALLVCALHGAPQLRVHAAALALYLAGGASEAFDWDRRPLFLQFGEDDDSHQGDGRAARVDDRPGVSHRLARCRDPLRSLHATHRDRRDPDQ